MKVVAFNGSPRKGGNCEQALNFMGEVFNTEQFIQNLWERENLQGINVRL